MLYAKPNLSSAFVNVCQSVILGADTGFMHAAKLRQIGENFFPVNPFERNLIRMLPVA